MIGSVDTVILQVSSHLPIIRAPVDASLKIRICAVVKLMITDMLCVGLEPLTWKLHRYGVSSSSDHPSPAACTDQ